MLFLIDEAHGYYEIPKQTRRQPPKRPPCQFTVFGSSQVWDRRKETAALKIKAAAIEQAHENLAALRRLFFFCRRPADYYLLSKKESRQQQLHGTACYRLCVCASGSLITVIFKSFTLTRVSCLHLGQNKGKFFNSVSSRILLRVLLPQTGQTIHLLLSMM